MADAWTTPSSEHRNGHICRKCVEGNPYADVPGTMIYQRQELALSGHYLLWTLLGCLLSGPSAVAARIADRAQRKDIR